MQKSRQVNLIEGPILKSLVTLAMPIMASSFLNTVYSITDMAWIGMLGAKVVAGVGVGGMYVWLSQGLASLARMGGQVLAAQYLGRGKKDDAREYARASLQLVVVFGILFALVCLTCTRGLVALFRLQDAETVESAVVYTRITCGMILFPYLSVVLTGLYTAQGDSKTPHWANFIGLVINMILDPVLILGIGPFPRLEVVGAASATVTAQFIVMLVLIVGCVKRPDNILREIHFLRRAEWKYYKGIFKIGVPTALQGTVHCMISMVLTRMCSVFGPAAVAVQRVGGQVEAVSWNTADGFAAALNAFAAQNYGAGKIERVRKGIRSCLGMTVVSTVVVSAFLYLTCGSIYTLFTDDTEVLRIGVEMTRFLVPTYITYICIEILSGALRGVGDCWIPTLICLTGVCLIRVVWIMAAVPRFPGITTIIFSYPLTWVITTVLFGVYYCFFSKIKIQKQAA